MRTPLFLLILLHSGLAIAQSVGDFSIPLRENSTGPQTLKSWAKANSTLWGTDASGNPQSITLGTGLTLSGSTISAAGGAWGTLTGTLTDQTDLAAALALKLSIATAASTYAPLVGSADLTNFWGGTFGTAAAANATDFLASQVTVIAADATLLPGGAYLITDATYTVTLPATPAIGDTINLIQDIDTMTGSVTLACNGNLIKGSAGDIVYHNPGPGICAGGVMRLIFVGGSTGWRYERFTNLTFNNGIYYSGTNKPFLTDLKASSYGKVIGSVDLGFGLVGVAELTLGTGLSITGSTLNLAPADSAVAFTDITTGNASTSKHGYLPKLGGGTTNFLRADGTWAAPASGLTIGTTTTSGASSGDIITSNGTVVQKLTPGTGVTTALGNAVNGSGGLLTYGIIGTSGSAVPLLNGNNTLSGSNTFASGVITANAPAINVTQEWNNSAVGFKAMFFNITTTAADYNNTAFMEFQRNGSTVMFMDHGGSMKWFGAGMFWDTNALKVQLPDAGYFSLGTDVLIYRDGGGTVNFRNSSISQMLRVSNTYTSTTNFEAGVIDWQTTANTLRIGSDVGSGGGTARDVQLIRGGTVKVTIGANTTDHAQPVQLPSYIVSGLPSAATVGAGSMAFVTDATATTAYSTVAGSGSNKVLVISDGTNWIIH